MIKSLSLCLGLTLALAVGTVAKAGGHGGAMPAPQAIPSAQVVASGQGGGYVDCPPVDPCAKKKHCFSLPKICLPKIHLPKCPPKCYTYEWCLKKKRCGGGLLGLFNKCGHDGDCGDGGGWSEPVYATGQQVAAAPSAQAWGTGQGGGAYGSGQIYGAGQVGGSGQFGGSGQMAPAPGIMEAAPVEEGDAAPEAPVVPSSFGRLGVR